MGGLLLKPVKIEMGTYFIEFNVVKFISGKYESVRRGKVTQFTRFCVVNEE
jgi:hypothetical protein